MLLYLVRLQSNGKIIIRVKGNVRDDANLNQLLVLANMESYNAILIEQGKSQSERLILLRNLAIRQMDTLVSINLSAVSALPGGDM